MVEERNADSSLSAAQQNLGEVRFPVSTGLADAAAALRTQGPGVSTGPRGRRGCSPAAAAENGGLQ